jgi:hypothetical protein
MYTLVLKLALTPILIGTASLAGRRWGPAISGWLVGLPFTSAPIALFLALDRGSAFAHEAAAGTLAGTLSQAAFCLTYAWLAARVSWPIALLASSLAFFAATGFLFFLRLPLVGLCVAIVAALIIALALMPRWHVAASAERRFPAWDLPARMILATAFVLLLTAFASVLGPQLTGLLAPFPLYAAILTAFAHQQLGAAAATGVLRGLILGLFAFAAFFATLAALIADSRITLAFVGATIVALLIQGLSLSILSRNRRANARDSA